jgi:hypothetical protein
LICTGATLTGKINSHGTDAYFQGEYQKVDDDGQPIGSLTPLPGGAQKLPADGKATIVIPNGTLEPNQAPQRTSRITVSF